MLDYIRLNTLARDQHSNLLDSFASYEEIEVLWIQSSGLYYKCFTIIIYNYNDSGQYYKTTITIVIDDPS